MKFQTVAERGFSRQLEHVMFQACVDGIVHRDWQLCPDAGPIPC